MKRPLPVALIFLILGILAGQYAKDVIVLFFVLIFILCVFIFLLYKSAAHTGIFLLIFVAGFVLMDSRLIPNPVLDEYVQNGRILTLHGTILDSSKTSSKISNSQRLIIHLDKIYDGEIFFECDTRIQAIVDASDALYVSQYVELSGQLLPLDGPRNPGGFNEMLYLRSKDISYKTYPTLLNTRDTSFGALHIKLIMNIFRNRLVSIFDETLPPDESGIIKSMVLGDKTGLSEELSDIYRVAGIYHILAISGLHVSIFGLIIELLLGRFLGRRTAGIATLIILILYCVMTGGSVSTLRAVCMLGVNILGRLLKRSSDLICSTSFAAILLLLYQPLYLWDIGFQYSFAAVFGIAYLTQPIDLVLRKLLHCFGERKSLPLNYLQRHLPAAIAATVITTPVVAAYFYYVPTYAIFVNVILVPGTFILLSLALTAGLLGLINVELATVLSGPVFYILKIYEAVASFFAELQFSTILTGHIPIIATILWYAGCVVFALCTANSWRKLLTSIFFISSIAIVIINFNLREGFIIDMLDVGQGDCIVISIDKQTFIIDGGGSRLGGTTGTRIIKPYLDYRGISKIEAVFITHFDADHVGGIIELLELKSVGTIFIGANEISKFGDDDDFYREILISLADKHKISIESISAGDTITAGDIQLHCLSPSLEERYPDPNTASLVLRLEYGNLSMLATGDIDTKVEAGLLKLNQNIEANILKLAHHGSKYSNSKEFVSKVSPDLAIVGTGRNNSYGHPSSVVRELLADLGVPLYNTAENGMIHIRSNGEEIWISGFVR